MFRSNSSINLIESKIKTKVTEKKSLTEIKEYSKKAIDK